MVEVRVDDVDDAPREEAVLELVHVAATETVVSRFTRRRSRTARASRSAASSTAFGARSLGAYAESGVRPRRPACGASEEGVVMVDGIGSFLFERWDAEGKEYAIRLGTFLATAFRPPTIQ